jgi:hypothetical protein
MDSVSSPLPCAGSTVGDALGPAPEGPVVGDQPDVEQPWWVKFALWGLPNRGSALASLWVLLAIAAACVALGFRDVRLLLGALAMSLAFWYLRAIRWVDMHGGWKTKTRV